KTFKVSFVELHPFGFPLGGNREPINAAALDDQLGFEPAGGEKESVKGGVAKELGFRGSLLPGASERAEAVLVRIAYPQTWLGREPVELAQPLRRGFEAWIVENLRFIAAGLVARSRMRLPFVTIPSPKALVLL